MRTFSKQLCFIYSLLCLLSCQTSQDMAEGRSALEVREATIPQLQEEKLKDPELVFKEFQKGNVHLQRDPLLSYEIIYVIKHLDNNEQEKTAKYRRWFYPWAPGYQLYEELDEQGYSLKFTPDFSSK